VLWRHFVGIKTKEIVWGLKNFNLISKLLFTFQNGRDGVREDRLNFYPKDSVDVTSQST
jgi:hypothetical protein